ncbi:PopZ family protein [Mesorhizobium sp. SB112]|uniref:PopZ family protein n=1 Tax=Mesorhizobium sp. SB112 TaxID=3151853 RepID=UPI00326395FC
MAQANSIQREPSMEEILASIRRIIEDSDTGRKPEDLAEIAAEKIEGSVIEVDAFRAELRAELDDVSKPEPAAVSAFDAPLRPAFEPRQSNPISAAVEALQQRAAPVEHFEEKPEANPAPQEEEAPVAYEDKTIEPEMELQNNDFEASPEQTVEQEPAVSEPVAAEKPEIATPQPVVTEVTSKPSIVSETTSKQVAAAFGELSEAFAASRRKSFDEMAEEMLRPMLQDWLDNNLPTLVERLVREEIERVARGAQ